MIDHALIRRCGTVTGGLVFPAGHKVTDSTSGVEVESICPHAELFVIKSNDPDEEYGETWPLPDDWRVRLVQP